MTEPLIRCREHAREPNGFPCTVCGKVSAVDYPTTLAHCCIEIVYVAPNVWEVDPSQSRYTHGRGLSVEYHPGRRVLTVNRFGIPVAVCTSWTMALDCVATKLGMR